MKRVSEGAFWSLVYLASVRVATLAISIAVGRLLGAAGTGAFGIALQTVNLASLLATFYMPQALMRALAATPDPARRRRLLFVSSAFVVCTGSVVAALLVFGADPIALRGFRQPALVPVFLACGPLIFATSLFLWAEGALQGLLLFRRLALWGVTVSSIDLVLTLWVAASGVPAILLCRSAVRVLAALVAAGIWLGPLMRTKPESSESPIPAWVELTGLLGYAGPALLSSLTALLGNLWIRVALTRDAGLGATGLYQVADSLAQGLIMIPAAVATAYLPAVARTRDAGYPQLGASVARALRMVTGINLPLCLLLVGIGPLLTRLLFGREFEGAHAALGWLCVGYGATGLTTVFVSVQLARGEVWEAFVAGGFWLAVVLLGLPFGIRNAGSGGAAAMVALAFVMTLLFYLFVLVRPWRLPLRPMLNPIFATLLLLLALVFASGRAFLPEAATALVALGLAAVVFGVWGRPAIAELRGVLFRA
jgi:O-antigen/teichoic acid export membrane protein